MRRDKIEELGLEKKYSMLKIGYIGLACESVSWR